MYSHHFTLARRGRQLLAGLAAIAASVLSASAQLSFNFIPTAGMSVQAIAGFQAAADRWSATFSDTARVNIAIDFRTLGAGILGGTSAVNYVTNYSSYVSALTSDRKSADDFLAVSSLSPGSSFGQLTNYTSTNPNGVGSAIPYVDNDGDLNNTRVRVAGALMKAVGLLPALNAAVDATIVFSDAFTWDFDPTNGIDPTAIDFVGIATHEIGHALGFGSGVDLLDTNSPAGGVFLDDAALRPTALDLFRYSALSAASGVVDQAADSRAKYFSIDGGLTWIANFSTGQVHGDGRQAAHWKDSPSGIIPLGILDPTAAPGELQKITDLDRRAFDVIGWDVIPVPEPGMYGFVGAALLGGLVVLRRRRQV